MRRDPAMQQLLDSPRDDEVSTLAEVFIDLTEWSNILYWRGEWFHHRDGYYQPLSAGRFQDNFDAFMEQHGDAFNDDDEDAAKGFKKRVLLYVKALCQVRDELELDTWIGDDVAPLQPPYIHFQNLLVNPVTGETAKPVPEFFLTNPAIDAQYDELAGANMFQRFLDQVLPDRGDQALLRRIFGYCLIPGNEYQRFFVFRGAPATGKSTTIDILRMLLGKHNCSAIPLTDLQGSFAIHNAARTLANFAGETSTIGKRQEDVINRWTGDGYITARDLYKQFEQIPIKSKLILTANELDKFETSGIWRRVIIIDFNEVIPEEDRVSDFHLTLSQELAGIANWSLQGLRKLIDSGGFRLTPEQLRRVQEHFSASRPVERFLAETFKDNPDGFVTGDTYALFRTWLIREGEDNVKISRKEYGEHFKRLFPAAKKVQKQVDGKRQWGWQGLEQLADVTMPLTY